MKQWQRIVSAVLPLIVLCTLLTAPPFTPPVFAAAAPERPDCQCGPNVVRIPTGNLFLAVTDLQLPGPGPAIALTRVYMSENAAKDGPFGPGWQFSLNNRLQMYVHHHLTEHEGNGSRMSFAFQDGTNGAFLSSYDGDQHIHIDLSKGRYESGTPGWSVKREAADKYLVTHGDGSVYTYKGYYAPWREPQDPRAGRLLSITDRNGNRVTFSYDGQGHVVAIADEYGRSLTFTWAGPHISMVRDYAGRTTTYTYTDKHLLVSDDGHPVVLYVHDAGGRLITQTGEPAGEVSYAYDAQGRVIQAGKALYTYAAGKTTFTDPAGGSWLYEMDAKQRLTREVDPQGRVMLVTYDEKGRRKSVTGLDQVVTTYIYDDQDRIVRTDSPVKQISFSYRASGTSVRYVEAKSTTILDYDTRGQLVGLEELGKPRVTYTYDDRGRVVTQTVAGQGTTRFAYDDPKNPHLATSITDPAGKVEHRSYDSFGRRIEEKDARP